MKAGFYKENISPVYPIPGRLGLAHMIEPYHDIFAKAIAFKNNNEIVLIISFEIVGLTRGLITSIKNGINKQTNIDKNNIILLGTHTHSSPFVWDLQAKQASEYGFHILDEPWLQKVINGGIKAGVKAINSLSTCTMYSGSAPTTKIVSNRVYPVTRWSVCEDDALRNAPIGLVDDTVRIIKVVNETGSVILSNLSCHTTAYGGGTTLRVSPDFPYLAERELKEAFDFEFLIYLEGSAGNSNSGKFNKFGSDEEANTIGHQYAIAINSALSNMKKVTKTFSYSYLNKSLPVGSFINDITTAKEKFHKKSMAIKEKIENNLPFEDDVWHWRLALKQLDVSLLSNGSEIKIGVQRLSFGSLNLVFVPGEWYVENYFALCKLYPEKDIILTTLNTFDLLYVPDKSNFDKHDWYGVKTSMRVLGDEGVTQLMELTSSLLK
ncbi:MAG: hypothetical protein KAG94_03540 [Clostridiales bacterium]|nr:hypothetical protein [Clostridiales bacterium]